MRIERPISAHLCKVEERTVIDNERGIAYSRPLLSDFRQLGCYMGSFGGAANQDMMPDALKIKGMVALQHIVLDANDFFTPLEELLAFERDEVRQGRAPFFVTATYDGKKRPVLDKGNLPGGGAAKAYGPSLKQAVNVGDDRYIKFWVKNFIRRREPRLEHLWNLGIQLDTSIYRLKSYVVVDDEGQQHRAQWDEPFPQTEAEWMDAGKWGMHRVKELAPDILLLHNPSLVQSCLKLDIVTCSKHLTGLFRKASTTKASFLPMVQGTGDGSRELVGSRRMGRMRTRYRCSFG